MGKKQDRKREVYEKVMCSDALSVLKSELKVCKVPDVLRLDDPNHSGVFFGRTNYTYDYGEYVGKPSEHDGHILVVGGTGSGKSSGIVIPTLDTWQGSIVAIDVKGELANHWFRRGSEKRPTKILSLGNIGRDLATYDPFKFLREDRPENLVQNACELAQAIVPLPLNAQDAFWIQKAQHLLTAAILYYCDIGSSFISAMVALQSTPFHKLIQDIGGHSNEVAKMFLNDLADTKDIYSSNLVTSIRTELSTRIMLFATDVRIKKALSPSPNCIDFEKDLQASNVFLSIPEDKLDQWGNVLVLVLTQLIRALERRQDINSQYGRYQAPLLLLLDEFPRFGKLEVIVNALATLRSKGVTICVVIQSLAQLDRLYGEHVRRIILDNCQYKAILNVADSDSQRYFSNLIGTTEKHTINAAVNFDSEGDEVGYTKSNSVSREAIIQPHEFAYLNDIVLHTPMGVYRIDKTPYFNR